MDTVRERFVRTLCESIRPGRQRPTKPVGQVRTRNAAAPTAAGHISTNGVIATSADSAAANTDEQRNNDDRIKQIRDCESCGSSRSRTVNACTGRKPCMKTCTFFSKFQTSDVESQTAFPVNESL